MATITSVTNFVGSKQWTDTSAWQGGVVPGTADIAQVRGIRATINQAAFPAWVGTITITVSSTSGFPTSGTFYSVTDRNQKVKINYTGTTATTFTGCTIDTSYFPWTVNNTPIYNLYGGNIANGTYVHFTPIIEVTGSVNAGTVIIENGGYLKIHSGGSFGFLDYITARDGTLHASGSATLRFELNNTAASSGTVSRLIGENFQLSQILFEGNENRTNSTLTANVAIGDEKITVANTSNFEVDDFIIIKDPNLNIQRVDDGFRAAYSFPTGSLDEVFQVAGKSGNDLYIRRLNTNQYPILSVSGNTVVLDSTQVQVGQKLVMNNDVYVVQSVSDYDYLIRDYDFTLAGTTLADWDTNVTRSAYFADFQKSASPVSGSAYALIQHNTTAYRDLVIKDIMRQDVKVEAWISNYRNVTTGTNDGGELGVIIHADPIMDYDYGLDSFAHTFFGINKDNGTYRLLQRAVSSNSTNLTTRAGVSTDFLRKFTVECRAGRIRGYVNDVLVNESFMRSGGYYGRVGVYCNAQNSFTCTQFKVYIPGQQVVLDKIVNATTSDKAYETGAEYTHTTGNVVIKQASIITDPLGHGDLAFGYRGASNYRNDAIFPYMYNAVANNTGSYARTTSTAFYPLLNGAMNYDLNSYNFASNNTTTGSMIVDLGAQRTITHVTFQEYFRFYGQFFSTGGYLMVRTSNDLTNWTTVPIRTGSEAYAAQKYDTQRRETPDSLRDYELQTPQTARYVQITRAGGNDSSTAENRWSSFGVHNHTGGFKLQLNNVSDYSVNDRVMILYNASYVGYNQESNWQPSLIAGTVPSSLWTSQLTEYYTVTAVDTQNKTITLDRPFTHGIVNGGERVVKLNREIKVRGDRGTGVWKSGRWNIYAGGQTNGRRYIVRNTEYTHMAGQYPTNLNTNYEISCFGHRNYNVFDADIYDNITYYNCLNQATQFGAYFNYTGGNILVRDSTMLNWNGRSWYTYFPSQYGCSYYNGNTFAFNVTNDHGFWTAVTNIYYLNNSNYGGTAPAVSPRFYPFYNTNVFNTPTQIFFKRNYGNGGQNSGFLIEMSQGFGYGINFFNEDNSYEYMDDYLVYQYRFAPFSHKGVRTPIQGNTNNRLTRFRNEGWVNPDKAMQQHVLSHFMTNYNGWNYNIAYQDYSYVLKYPSEDYYRFYRVNPIWQNAILGTTFQVLDSSSATFNYSFEYVHDMSQWAQNEHTYTGSLAQFVLKDGARYISDVVIPKVTGSLVYRTGSVTVTGPGVFNIGLGQASLSGYVAFKNVKNTFTSTNPSSLRIFSNTFDSAQMESPDVRDYTTNNYTLNINLT